jgi:hypothetical protein
MRRFGVDGIPSCGWHDEVLKAQGLDAETLATAISTTMRGRNSGTKARPRAASRKLA